MKALVSSARQQVLLCAPFIKVSALSTVFSKIEDEVAVRVVTRWRAIEVASGVSDLGVFEITNERKNTELALLDDLHAKLFLADDEGLAGSANLTATALGWTERSNIELLFPVKRSDPDVKRLLRHLDGAITATYTTRSAMEAEAAKLSMAHLYEVQDVSIYQETVRNRAWLPICAAPEKLRTIYKDPTTAAVVDDTKADGLSDLRDLHIPKNLALSEFDEVMRDTLLLMPAFRRIVDHIPQGLTDAEGVAQIVELRPSLPESDVSLQWRIVRDWISEFFRDEFEVAPKSFIIRLRQR